MLKAIASFHLFLTKNINQVNKAVNIDNTSHKIKAKLSKISHIQFQVKLNKAKPKIKPPIRACKEFLAMIIDISSGTRATNANKL